VLANFAINKGSGVACSIFFKKLAPLFFFYFFFIFFCVYIFTRLELPDLNLTGSLFLSLKLLCPPPLWGGGKFFNGGGKLKTGHYCPIAETSTPIMLNQPT